ncbi:MAG: Gfo/Idh/MocA family oxidoreductase [Actinomycetota bacterium]
MTLRAVVLGLGMIGRHHARILQSLDGVDFVGGADPTGDRYGALGDPSLLYASVEELLEATRPQIAVVALPTEEHVAASQQLAAAGIHALIEKPLAATAAQAQVIIDLFTTAGLHAVVGHVERFNPALMEMRQRLDSGQIGTPFLIATQRIGPFPDRIRDVGVVKDLATHDLDLVGWLGGAAIDRVAAQTTNRTGRPHEDVVLVTGQLQSGLPFNCIVDWLSPTKIRSVRVLGDRGMLIADTVRSDLTFYENATVSSDWESSAALRGVSEGDVIRYALSRREPLLAELEAFRDLVLGDGDAAVVGLQAGLAAVQAAEAVLRSAESASTEIVYA